jgi:tetratricopeptide (TPR) repeat protein
MYEFKFQDKLALAASYESLDNNLHAVQIYTALINEDETYLESYFRLVELYEKTGRIEEASAVIEKMVDINNRNEYALIMAAEFYLFHLKWREALAVMYFIDSADFPIIQYWKGLCYYNLNQFESAINPLKESYKYYKNEDYTPQVIFLLAKVEFELRNFKSALEYAEKYEYIDSNNWEINLFFAKLYLEMDMLTHASQKISLALHKKKNNVEIIKTAARIYYKNDELEKAEKYFNLVVENSDDVSAELYSNMASLAFKRKDFNKAQLYYELALKIDPGYEAAVNAINTISRKKPGLIKNDQNNF